MRNPRFGLVKVKVFFDEVYWDPSARKDKVRWKKLTDSHTTLKQGWRNIFTHTETYKVRRSEGLGILKASFSANKILKNSF